MSLRTEAVLQNNQSSPQKKGLFSIEEFVEKRERKRAKKLAKAIKYRTISNKKTPEALDFVKEKAIEDSVNDLAITIRIGNISLDNLPKILNIVLEFGTEKEAVLLAETLGDQAVLSNSILDIFKEDELFRILDFIVDKGGDEAMMNLERTLHKDSSFSIGYQSKIMDIILLEKRDYELAGKMISHFENYSEELLNNVFKVILNNGIEYSAVLLSREICKPDFFRSIPEEYVAKAIDVCYKLYFSLNHIRDWDYFIFLLDSQKEFFSKEENKKYFLAHYYAKNWFSKKQLKEILAKRDIINYDVPIESLEKDEFDNFVNDVKNNISYNKFRFNLNNNEKIEKNDSYFRYVNFYLEETFRDYNRRAYRKDLTKISKKLDIDAKDLNSKEILRRIDPLIKTVPIKSMIAEKFLPLKKTDKKLVNDLLSYFNENLRLLFANDFSKDDLKLLLNDRDKKNNQIIDIFSQFLKEDSEKTMEDLRSELKEDFFENNSAVFNILSSNQDKNTQLANLYRYLSKSKIADRNAINFLWKSVFEKADLVNILNKHFDNEQTQEDTVILISKLANINQHIKELKEDFKEEGINLNIHNNLSDTESYQLINETILESSKSVFEISWVFKDRDIVSLWQGYESGTCFDNPADFVKKENIIPINLLKNKKLIGNALVLIADKRMILVGFDPSERFVKAKEIDGNFLERYTWESLHVFQQIAKKNNLNLAIGLSREIGGITNRGSDISDYIYSYLTEDAKIKYLSKREHLTGGYFVSGYHNLSQKALKKLEKTVNHFI